MRDVVPTHPRQLAIWSVDVRRRVLVFGNEDASPGVGRVGRVGRVGGEAPVTRRGIVGQQQLERQFVVQRELEKHTVVRRRFPTSSEPGGGSRGHLHAYITHLELLTLELVGGIAPLGHLARLVGGVIQQLAGKDVVLFRWSPSLDILGEESLLASGYRAIEIRILRRTLTSVGCHAQPAVMTGLRTHGYATVGPCPLRRTPTRILSDTSASIATGLRADGGRATEREKE